MDKLYLQNNYVVVEKSGETFVFSKNFCTYYETATSIVIQQFISTASVRTLAILISDIPNFYDQSGVTPYTTTTFKTFLRTNTGFKSASGGSGAAWGTITGTLTSQTDLNTALNSKQDNLISGTNIKTINGNSLIGSGNITIGGLTIGTTAITSGAANRLLFEGTGNVLQQSSNLTFDSTTNILQCGNRIIAGTSGMTNTGGALFVYAGNNNDFVQRIYNTAGTAIYNFRTTSNGSYMEFCNSTGTPQVTIKGQWSDALTFGAGRDIYFDTGTGTKIGAATNQKFAFWNKTPITQPTTAIAAATFTANTSGIANDTATFDGYTIGQIVKALRNVGLLQ